MKIDSNLISRRCHNLEAVERAIERSRQRRSAIMRKPAATEDTSDPAVIMAIADARGCLAYGKFWTEHKVGTPQEFLAALAANSNPIRGLFGNTPVR
jgi:hypothetical protein